ncbi:hypothetical protein GOL81_23295 [Sinorhizobium medicae]|uniref:hypothetical protein n=1 Tax=Sinorhizobium medicae TaxID=110321 RepID=UPI000C7E56C2|nr:hypothetical protein [Sinorhizobium medicae]MDX0893626.1 hypothetical protein [Sinorhizobium medicae]MDX0935377.1 hypothetical protein [Sinorhizobium medicae]MDX0938720.1 hypothetical protein [Sinorhizobium medicae]MDX1102295.1 hypothetical protein [Sinorhizobium medicae]MDX1149835.1 hypothetical protein [Sinorhizobium medicae]
MAKFNAGQTVVAVKDFHSSYYGRIITTGKRYEIISVGQSTGRVGVRDDRGSKRFFSPDHFMSVPAYEIKRAQEQLNRFEPGEIVPVGSFGDHLFLRDGHGIIHVKPKPKRKTPRSIKVDPRDAKAALTKMLKEVYGIDATVEQVIGAMDKSLELVLGA